MGHALPGVLGDFLERASAAVAATRDARLVPRVHWISGFRLEDDRTTLLALVGQGSLPGLVENLRDNGSVALTAEVIGSHETHQFKGTCLEHRELASGDHAIFEACRERYVVAVCRLLGNAIPADVVRTSFRAPALALRFTVHEVFVQTPGPAAGQRLFSREAGA